MAQTPALLVDDRDPNILYNTSCFSSAEQGANSCYKGTFTTSEAPSNECSNGWFNYTFHGTGVHVAASILSANTSYTVRLDDGEVQYQVGQGSYYSPILPDGQHTITYAFSSPGFSLPLFDYLAITPGLSTPLQGQTLAVDDSDSSISFSGSWSPVSPISVVPPLYRGTAHWSSVIGDSLQFEFEGSSISIFGTAVNVSEGAITTMYTLDGVPTISGLPRGTIGSTSFVQLFHADVKSGSHALIVNITGIQLTQALGIDLIAYNASFNSISSLPSLSGSKPKSSLNTGSKIGITFGVLAFAAIVAALLLFLRRKYTRPKNLDSDFTIAVSSW
ncbi:hypothetical protein CPB84DRAFT_1688421 [Gymnopilus junonius]|uniref:Uncharacterized protein n=1 Tax=Gymnopilus junonius TaxID=109634 RepID=A0A9P5NCX6_GYMJU|nr:hypothetical protein CPB84DRAFT_1688421 [Gymnopilus junonius]